MSTFKKSIIMIVAVSVLTVFMTASFPVGAVAIFDDALIWGGIIVALMTAIGGVVVTNNIQNSMQNIGERYVSKVQQGSITGPGTPECLNGVVKLDPVTSDSVLQFIEEEPKDTPIETGNGSTFTVTFKDTTKQLEPFDYPGSYTSDQDIRNSVLFIPRTDLSKEQKTQIANNIYVGLTASNYFALYQYDTSNDEFVEAANYATSSMSTMWVGLMRNGNDFLITLGGGRNPMYTAGKTKGIPVTLNGDIYEYRGDTVIPTVKPEDNIYINLGGDVIPETIEDIPDIVATNIETGVAIDTPIISKYDSVGAPGIPTLTGHGFLDGINTVWKYVVYLYEQAAAGIQEFFAFTQSIPRQILWCIYGGVVLCLFAGVVKVLLQ